MSLQIIYISKRCQWIENYGTPYFIFLYRISVINLVYFNQLHSGWSGAVWTDTNSSYRAKRVSVNWGRQNIFTGKGIKIFNPLPDFHGKGPKLLLLAGSPVGRWKIACGVRRHPYFWGWRHRVGDPCRKRHCTINRLIGTLQLSLASPIANAVYVAVLQLAPCECAVARHANVENFSFFQSFYHY
jgi:hypothetical protein